MKIKEILLGIIIAVIFLMICVFGTKLIYDTPKYEDYCNYSKINAIPTALDKTNLSQAELQAQSIAQQAEYDACSKAYDAANKDYSKKMFIISLIFGILVIIISTVFIEVNSISGGLMLGSIIFVIYGTARYWSYMDDLTRFILLCVVLGILIYLAYWASKKMDNKGVINRNKKPKKK
jgi:hypothetical protein